MMLNAVWQAFAQLPDPAYRRPLAFGLGLTVLVYLLLGWLSWSYLVPLLVETDITWLATLAALGAKLVFLVAMAVLFPAISTLFICFFLDDVASAVERRHYPGDPPGKPLPLVKSLAGSLRFAVVTICLNIVFIPVYLVAIWFPPLKFVVFGLVNGYLFGREYFELVAWRHVSQEESREMFRRFRWLWITAGAMIAFMFAVPLLNLLAPVVATGFMVHMLKSRLRDSAMARAK